MDIIVALRPKNMSVREVAWTVDRRVRVTTYVFNGREYTHVGNWPPLLENGGFHVPIRKAWITVSGKDITQRLRRFAGPRHVVTQDTVRYAFGTWSWHVRIAKYLKLETYPVFRIPDAFPDICVTDVLGHTSEIRCAK